MKNVAIVLGIICLGVLIAFESSFFIGAAGRHGKSAQVAEQAQESTPAPAAEQPKEQAAEQVEVKATEQTAVQAVEKVTEEITNKVVEQAPAETTEQK